MFYTSKMDPLNLVPFIQRVVAFSPSAPKRLHELSGVSQAWRETIDSYSNHWILKDRFSETTDQASFLILIFHRQMKRVGDIIRDNYERHFTLQKLFYSQLMQSYLLEFLSYAYDERLNVYLDCCSLVLRLLSLATNRSKFNELLHLFALFFARNSNRIVLIEMLYLRKDLEIARYLFQHMPEEHYRSMVKAFEFNGRYIDFLVQCNLTYSQIANLGYAYETTMLDNRDLVYKTISTKDLLNGNEIRYAIDQNKQIQFRVPQEKADYIQHMHERFLDNNKPEYKQRDFADA